MKMKFILIFILITNLQFAQEIEFGEISKEDLRETSYANDPSANAVLLFQRQETYFNSTTSDLYLMTEIHKRIKIYSKDGFEKATEEIMLFKSGNTKEKVKKLKAYTYNLNGDQIERTELDKDQIFETEISFNYEETKFTMPNVKEGSIIEFKYEIQSPFVWNMDELRFQYDIPVKKLHTEIRFPKGFNFKPTPKGFIDAYPNRYTKIDHRLGSDVNIFEYDLHNVPALKEEPFVDDMNNYTSGVVFELMNIDLPGYFRSYSQTWQDVAESIGSSEDYKRQLDKTNSFNDELDDLLTGDPTQEEKMRIIFNYVKKELKWNNLDGKYFFNGIKKTLKEKTGNAADINLTLVAMLRYAGIDANPLVISTKDNLIPYFPTVDRLNYVIAFAKVDDKQYFMDATDEFSDINILPVKDYNWKGILIDNNKKRWQSIYLDKPDQALSLLNVTGQMNDDGEVDGKIQSRYTSHKAYNFRQRFKKYQLDEYLSELESSYKGLEVSEHQVENATTHEGFVNESFSFFSENMSEVVGDKIYFKPMAFLGFETNPFKAEEREFPVDFGYPLKSIVRVNVTLPEGYVVESVPESTILKLPENLGQFKYIVKQIPSGVQVLYEFDLVESYINPNHYLFLKEYFNQVVSKEKEAVVLKKV